MTDKINKIYGLKFLLLVLVVTMLSSCDNNVEPEPDSFVGFWQAEELLHHFWLDENIDSLSGFGQIARMSGSGFIEWIHIDVGGIVNGSNIALIISYSNSQSTFTGTVVSTERFVGTWIAEGDTTQVTYNKRTGR